jgi:hypothetical protein
VPRAWAVPALAAAPAGDGIEAVFVDGSKAGAAAGDDGEAAVPVSCGPRARFPGRAHPPLGKATSNAVPRNADQRKG